MPCEPTPHRPVDWMSKELTSDQRNEQMPDQRVPLAPPEIF
jgi:hypothetical protein